MGALSELSAVQIALAVIVGYAVRPAFQKLRQGLRDLSNRNLDISVRARGAEGSISLEIVRDGHPKCDRRIGRAETILRNSLKRNNGSNSSPSDPVKNETDEG